MNNIDTLFHYAADFRNGIDTAKRNGLFDFDYNMCHFPYGCCGDTADLLGQYFINNGIHPDYVCGCYYYGADARFQSHAWLEFENILIDISADQFREKERFLYYSVPVYVGPIDNFHKLFEADNRRKAYYLKNMAPESMRIRLQKLYGIIVDSI